MIAATDDVGGIRARALSLVGADQLRRAGMKVDFQEMDFGTVVRRRASHLPHPQDAARIKPAMAAGGNR